MTDYIYDTAFLVFSNKDDSVHVISLNAKLIREYWDSVTELTKDKNFKLKLTYDKKEKR